MIETPDQSAKEELARDQSAPSGSAQPAPPRRLDTYVSRSSRPMTILAIIFLLDFLMTVTYDGWSPEARTALNLISWFVWVVFALDYAIRLVLSPDKWQFIKTHKLDLLMVLVPMLRLMRVAILLRRGLGAMRDEQIAGSVFFVVATLIVLGATLVLIAESKDPDANITTFRDALWWAVVTTTTVGYGDYYPVTLMGRIVAAGVMLMGIGLIGTVSASAAAWLIKRRKPADEGAELPKEYTLADVMARLDDLAAEQARLKALLAQTPPEGTSPGLN